MDNQIKLYQTENGSTQLEVKLENDTLWLNLLQLTELFGRDKSVISRHLKTIFDSGELMKEAVVAKNATTAADGKTYQVEYFNLDAIISVGYRVNSIKGTQFRIWATNILRQHLVQGYTLNKSRFEQNAQELEQALTLIRKTAQSPELNTDSGRGLVEIVSRYTQTFLWLQRYDVLIERGEATDLFAKAHGDGLAATLGNLDQTIFGEPAYPTIESKAAHLLYFIVKNHPFTDGNKRSGAFLFVDFLHRNKKLFTARGEPIINDTGLAALTLLVAESDPKQKEVLIRLIMNMLASHNN
ncbi:MAG: Death-on-curing family protein [Cellvibrio sp.]|nr:Death-on-curing family protein [Cellvibrio sp.]